MLSGGSSSSTAWAWPEASEAVDVSIVTIANVLTRASGYLKTVCSHSLQPYRGCTLGRALCGVGCYVRSNGHVLRGRTWGSFLEVRENAAESYLQHFDRERAWARRSRGSFSIFLSSATEPFLPQEKTYRITHSVLEAMRECPPDELILQTHSADVAGARDVLLALSKRCDLRVHVSIESDRDRLPGLPPPASSVDDRLEAARTLRAAGLRTVITVSPLLPIEDPEAFFARICGVADAVVIDHFIGGDGSPDGQRTLRTELPAAMAKVDPDSLTLAYRDRMIGVAQRYLPGRVGVGQDGFAGRHLPEP